MSRHNESECEKDEIVRKASWRNFLMTLEIEINIINIWNKIS